MRNPFFTRPLKAALLVLAALFLVFAGIAAALADRLAIEGEAKALLKTAAVAAELFSSAQDSGQPQALSAWAARLSTSSGSRVSLLDGSGSVVADSRIDPSSMENHRLRPEVAKAREGQMAWALRRSTTTGERTLYAALPLASPRGWILRLASPLPSPAARLYEARWLLGLALLFLGLAAAILGLGLERGLARPMARLLDKAQAYAAGSPAPKDRTTALSSEFAALDRALEDLVEGARKRSAEAGLLGRRLSSILEAAGEGIVAVDESLVVLEANSAAAGLFGVAKDDLLGKSFLEAFRSREAADFLASRLSGGTESYRNIRIFEGGEKHIKIHATRFAQDSGQAIVAVFSDIGELVRLERVRKEFVANVSHELRTPVQIIRGYAELIAEGRQEGEVERGYASLIEKTALRMERIVADLLLLARLENGAADDSRFEECALGDLFASTLALLGPKAAAKSIEIVVTTDGDLRLSANPGLIEQALFNLLENAVNYSPEGSRVSLSARRVDPGSVEIEVADRGVGIPQADLARIFERFYRVDKSRSKATGGTGLGLAIVKHIAELHGGSVSAASYRGEGTTFSLRLPAMPREPAAQASPPPPGP